MSSPAQPRRDADSSWQVQESDAFLKQDKEERAAPDPADSGVDWEGSLLQKVTDLLDSLEEMRARWGTLNRRLLETEEDLRRAEREGAGREAELERVSSELENLRAERDALAAASAELTSTSDALHDARRRLEAVERERDELREAREEADALRDRLAELEREREELRGAKDLADSVQTELREKSHQLSAVTRERDTLAEAVRGIEETRDRIENLERECAKAKKAAEESLLEACDLRVKVNKLEGELDEANRTARKKSKKILSKIHESLDDAGAPTGDEMSFGERIRRLKQRIEELEAG
jgi:chromosome segregation ATPase